jgi:hypothetical protein
MLTVLYVLTERVLLVVIVDAEPCEKLLALEHKGRPGNGETQLLQRKIRMYISKCQCR